MRLGNYFLSKNKLYSTQSKPVPIWFNYYLNNFLLPWSRASCYALKKTMSIPIKMMMILIMTIIALTMIIMILTDTMKRRIITIEKFQ